jgi:hypothetical protein
MLHGQCRGRAELTVKHTEYDGAISLSMPLLEKKRGCGEDPYKVYYQLL